MSRRREFMDENNLKKSKTSRFILPMYGQPLFKNSPLNYYLINSYFDKDNHIYVVFDNINDDKLTLIIYNLTCDPNYIDSSYADDNMEVILKLKIPKEFEADFTNFKQGKFTKFSTKFKKLLEESYGRVSSRKERDKLSGKPIIKVFDAINPIDEKYKDIANYYGVELAAIMEHGEILEAPDEDKELFKTIEELYGIKQ